MKLLSLLAFLAIAATLPAAVQAKPVHTVATATQHDRQTPPEKSTSEVRASSCQQAASSRGKDARSTPRYEQAPRLCEGDKPDLVDDRIK